MEAGLNDGLSVPFLMFFLALATTQGEARGSGVLGRFLIEQLGYGTLIGLAIGLAGGWLLNAARRSEWMAAPLTRLGFVALPLGCALASEATGASMFIAALVAWLAIQYGYPDVGRHSVELADDSRPPSRDSTRMRPNAGPPTATPSYDRETGVSDARRRLPGRYLRNDVSSTSTL